MDEQNNVAVRAERICQPYIRQCKSCKLDCAIKHNLQKINPAHECVDAEAAKTAELYNHPVMNKQIITGLAIKAIKTFHNRMNVQDLRHNKDYYDMLLKYKEAFYPEVSRNANVNIQVNAAREIVEAMLKEE